MVVGPPIWPVTSPVRLGPVPAATPLLTRTGVLTALAGAQPTKEGFDALAKMGIGIVVDLRGSREGERQEVTKLGMRYVPIPWRCFHPQDAIFAQFLTLLRENPGKKVFVHCPVGDDRTGMMIAAYRMAEQGWTAEKVRKEMKAYGVGFFHRMICPGLSSYEENFSGNSRPALHSKASVPSSIRPQGIPKSFGCQSNGRLCFVQPHPQECCERSRQPPRTDASASRISDFADGNGFADRKKSCV